MADEPKPTAANAASEYIIAYNKLKNGTVVQVRLHLIDAHGAVRRFPHEWAWKPDAFAAKAPPKSTEVDISDLIGQTGGNPAMEGGVGVLRIVDPKEATAA